MVRGENLRRLFILGVHETLIYSYMHDSVVVDTKPSLVFHLTKGGFFYLWVNVNEIMPNIFTSPIYPNIEQKSSRRINIIIFK